MVTLVFLPAGSSLQNGNASEVRDFLTEFFTVNSVRLDDRDAPVWSPNEPQQSRTTYPAPLFASLLSKPSTCPLVFLFVRHEFSPPFHLSFTPTHHQFSNTWRGSFERTNISMAVVCDDPLRYNYRRLGRHDNPRYILAPVRSSVQRFCCKAFWAKWLVRVCFVIPEWGFELVVITLETQFFSKIPIFVFEFRGRLL